MFPHVIVMGVSGCGKSSLASAIAQHTGRVFVEGDDFHPAANVAKMRAGQPLSDDDRRPWLLALAAELDRLERAGYRTVLSCSSLKRMYRDTLRCAHGAVYFVELSVGRDELLRRLTQRQGHFMPPDLLLSQLATLESLAASEPGVIVDGSRPIADIVRELDWLGEARRSDG